MIWWWLPISLAGGFDHDYAALDAVYDGAVSVAGVDYRVLATRRARLDEAIGAMAAVSIEDFTGPQKLALYVNAYNAYTLQIVLDAMPLDSIRDLDGGKVWDTRTFRVAGVDLTLNQIEHDHARKLADGRVHAVVSCASRGCPPLQPEPIRPRSVEAQLDTAARQWASHNAWAIVDGTLQLSPIFDWYGEDFPSGGGDIPGVEGKQENALWFLAGFVEKRQRAQLISGRYPVVWAAYDWRLNAR